MFCPSCGKEIPDDSRFCLGCGKSPTAALNKAAEHQASPHPESHTLRNIVLAFVGLVGLYVIAMIVSNGNKGTFPGIPKRDPLTAPVFTVRAAQMYYVRFEVQGSSRVVGRFQASGGSGNDIEAAIMDADDFENWRNGHQSRALYQSGKTTIGTINVPINQPGTYYIAFNNQFSLLSDKTITASILLHH